VNAPLPPRTLAYRRVPSAKVQAWRSLLDGPGPNFDGGPVLRDPRDARLRHCRAGAAVDHQAPDDQVAYNATLAGTWNYVGPTHPHFGHVMAEMVHRVLPSRECFGHDAWLVVAPKNSYIQSYREMSPPHQSALEFLGVSPDRIRVIRDDTIVESLNIVEQGAHLGSPPEQSYLEMLRSYSERRLNDLFANTPRSAKVYVSRSDMRGLGNFLGERWIEGLFEREGFTIFKPEAHTLSEQMDVYRRASWLVFNEGSACHGAELLGREMLGNVFVLTRRPGFERLWANVLTGRAQSFQSHLVGDTVGSCARHRLSGVVLSNFMQTLVDIDRLAHWLRSAGLGAFPINDGQQYYRAAALDLEDQMAAVTTYGPERAPADDLDAMRAKLAEYTRAYGY